MRVQPRSTFEIIEGNASRFFLSADTAPLSEVVPHGPVDADGTEGDEPD